MKIHIAENINPANDYTELLAREYIRQGHMVLLGVQNFYYSNFVPDILHIQWPEAIYRWRHTLELNKDGVRFFESRLKWFKKNGTKIVHTIHNLLPHHTTNVKYEKSIYQLIIDYSDILVHHGSASIDILDKTYANIKQKNNITCKHGPYDAPSMDCSIARNKYGIPWDAFVILNFGRQRPNKGETFIDKLFTQIDFPNKYLFTIGPRTVMNPGKVNRILSLLNERIRQRNLKKIKRVYRNFPPKEIPFILNACDLVFLGHKSGLNSGVASLAASYSKPVIIPDIGNIREQVEDWMYEAYQVNDMTDAVESIHKMIQRINDKGVMDNARWLEINRWEKHVNTIIEYVEKLQ
ncbi:hypothetical protein [uncultured Desulfobacter sp.]|uniref:glycosyltransferase n=1 Tax=uncultured Desulfobacter sp. TaxID=240139 RepID=UPI0029F5BAFC|nr:hypothetical protein [uncultured Desulfobacter sp.]